MMQDNIVLKVVNVSKKYCFSLRQLRKYGFKDIISAITSSKDNVQNLRSGEFWAVNNVSFDLKKGESLGLIGLNGAGKSTLLKMIKGLIIPDVGEIAIDGEVGALIELGAGFHPMLTGRENIYIKGALLGKTRSEMNDILADIIEFAEIGEFIDAPLKNYSSGMNVRLGFAIAIFMEPDILLLDEVLAVGDFKFRQKCLDKVNQLRNRTSTIFVSHSMDSVSLFCDRTLVLEKGKMAFLGKTDDAIRFYMSEVEKKQNNKLKTKKGNDVRQFFGDLFYNDSKIGNVEHYWADKNLKKIEIAETGDEVNIVIRFHLKVRPANKLVVGVPIWDKNGILITGFATDSDKIELKADDDYFNIVLNLKELTLNPNEYHSVVAIVDGMEFYYRMLNEKLVVNNFRRNFGYFTAHHEWIIKN